LISGTSGKEKPLFASFILYNGSGKYGENLVSCHLRRSHPIDVIRNASSFGWRIYRELIDQGKLFILDASPDRTQD